MIASREIPAGIFQCMIKNTTNTALYFSDEN